MAVHLQFATNGGGFISVMPDGLRPPGATAQVAHVRGMTAVDVEIGGAAVQVPPGCTILSMHETTGAAFRWTVGDNDTVTVPATGAFRMQASCVHAFGVDPGMWIKTAVA